MKPRLILTDLDGTLLDEEKRLSPRNRAALERAHAQGAEVVVATGRFYSGVPQEVLDLPFLRYFILMNGAKVYDRVEDRSLYRAEIPLETAERIFDMIEDVDATLDCFQNDKGLMARRYFDNLDYYIHDLPSRALVRRTRIVVEDFREAVRSEGDSIQKIQFYFPDLELRRVIQDKLGREFPEVVTSISMPENLEVNDLRATKGNALLALCQALSIDPLEAIAFGDGTNDVSMMREAGVGVAMANATPGVLEAADLVAPSNLEDGVGRILEQWFVD